MSTKKEFYEGSKSAREFFKSNLGPLTLGAFIRAIREGEELSQVEFAKQLKMSRSHLNDIEKNRKSVSPSKAKEYAKKLGYSESQFIRLALQDLLKREKINLLVEVKKVANEQL